MDKIVEILREIRPGVDWETATSIIDDALLDSFDMIMLVGELEEAFGIRIGLEHLEPYNFNTVEAIIALVEELSAD